MDNVLADRGAAGRGVADRGAVDRGAPGRGPFVIALGNEKGGTGKSTTAVHVAIGLLSKGYRVGTIDLDSRQATLTRYLENRRGFASAKDIVLPSPEHVRVERSPTASAKAARTEETVSLDDAFESLAHCDFIIVDTPGSDSHLSRLGHLKADLLITPLNDSFVDLDVLAVIDREKRQVRAPSFYSRMVWEQNNLRVVQGKAPLDWVVMRNRLSHSFAHNKRDMTRLLDLLGRRIGFRLAPGFGERVIFRELFTRGLTVLDSPAALRQIVSNSKSHAAARDELRGVLAAIGLPQEVLAGNAS